MKRAICCCSALSSSPSCGTIEAPKADVPEAKAGTRLEILGTDSTGITFRNTIVEDRQANYFRYLYMYNGGGVATGDIDGDGLADLAFVSYRSGGALYKNLGGMKFADISASSGFSVNDIWATGVSMADVNADGRLDIYVCASGPAGWAASTRRNKLFINLGDGKFGKEDAATAGLDDEGHNTMAYFAHLDRDDDLDCFITSRRFRLHATRTGTGDAQAGVRCDHLETSSTSMTVPGILLTAPLKPGWPATTMALVLRSAT